MTLAFPQPLDDWVGNKSQLADTGRGLLETVGQALDAFGRGDDYQRRTLQHGNTNVWAPNAPAIYVNMLGLFPGRAGQQQFQFPYGELGKVALRFGRYEVEVVNEYVAATTGGPAPRLPSPAAYDDAVTTLWTDAWIGWCALQALANGGIAPNLVTRITQDMMLLASMTAKGPQGQLAGVSMIVEVQLS